jgi:hypothetical protein
LQQTTHRHGRVRVGRATLNQERVLPVERESSITAGGLTNLAAISQQTKMDGCRATLPVRRNISALFMVAVYRP